MYINTYMCVYVPIPHIHTHRLTVCVYSTVSLEYS